MARTRDSKGRFKRHHSGARRSTAIVRHNPAAAVPVLLANPRHRRVRHRRGARVVVVNPESNPRRRRHHYRIHRNPRGSIVGVVKFAAFGAVGILLARLARYWLDQVVPATYKTGMIGAAIRVGGAGVASWGAGKLVGSMAGAQNGGAVELGGFAETLRGLVGEVLGLAAPTFTRGQVGLDAPIEMAELPQYAPEMGEIAPQTFNVDDMGGALPFMGDVVEADTFGDVVEPGTF